jgi:hypothetical protein
MPSHQRLSKHWPKFKVLRQHYAGTRFEEQRQLHLPQNHKATVPESTLRVEMNGLEEQAEKAKARDLYWKPLSWLGTIRPTSANDAFDPALWTTFVSTTLGLEVPVLSSLPRRNNSPLLSAAAKNTAWTFTATTQPRAQLTQVQPRRTTGWWGPLPLSSARLDTRSAPSMETRPARANGAATWRSATTCETRLVLDLSTAHERYGSSSHPLQNGHLTRPQDIDAPLHVAEQRKMNSLRQQYADNQNISFLPTIFNTSTRMHSEFLRLLFLQAHREIEAHFTATGMPSQRNQSDSFRFKRAAFYQSLKSKVGLAAAKAAALRINLNIEGCGVVVPPMHVPSRAPLRIPLLLSHNLPFPRVHWCVMDRLAHTGLGSSSLVAHVLHYPPPPTRTALY